MLLAALRDKVLRANREIARRGLAPHTFGNASAIDRSSAWPGVLPKDTGDWSRTDSRNSFNLRFEPLSLTLYWMFEWRQRPIRAGVAWNRVNSGIPWHQNGFSKIIRESAKACTPK